jgi:hypothetical protein
MRGRITVDPDSMERRLAKLISTPLFSPQDVVQFNRGFNMVCFLGLSAVDDFALFFLAHRDRLRIFRLSFVMSSGTNCVFYGLVCCRSVQAPVQQPWLALVVV